jgi:hypothetical protein
VFRVSRTTRKAIEYTFTRTSEPKSSHASRRATRVSPLRVQGETGRSEDAPCTHKAGSAGESVAPAERRSGVLPDIEQRECQDRNPRLRRSRVRKTLAAAALTQIARSCYAADRDRTDRRRIPQAAKSMVPAATLPGRLTGRARHLAVAAKSPWLPRGRSREKGKTGRSEDAPCTP